jgi:hypothetical protein
MKSLLSLVAFFIFSRTNAQVIPNTGNPSAGSIIWYTSFTLKNGAVGAAIGNYQSAILKDGLGEKYMIVINSNDWLKGIKSRPSHLSLYETPGYAMQVVLDFTNYTFKFYPWNAKDLNGIPHHSNTILNFIGNDHKPYSISFADFVGR